MEGLRHSFSFSITALAVAFLPNLSIARDERSLQKIIKNKKSDLYARMQAADVALRSGIRLRPHGDLERAKTITRVARVLAHLLLSQGGSTLGSSVARSSSVPLGRKRADVLLCDEREKSYILVTGSSQGIGYAVCEALAGASSPERPIVVIASGRSAAGSMSAKNKILEALSGTRGLEVFALELDVADEVSRAHALRKLRGILGKSKLSGLVNNAGIAADLPWAPAPADISYGEFTQQVLETNFHGPVELSKSLVEEGLLSGGSRIVFVSSGGGHIAINKVFPSIKDVFMSPQLSTDRIITIAKEFVEDAKIGGVDQLKQKWNYTHRYGFSKLCVSAVSRTLAREYPSMVVHACTPGFVRTRMTVGSSADLTPEQGASVIVHLLLSEDARLMESGKFFNHKLEELTWDDDRYVSAK